VGTRAATPNGLDDARELGATLARAGVTVVSGLAIGIDGAAHEGALAAGGSDQAARRAALRRLFARARPITDVRGSLAYRAAMLDVMSDRTWTLAATRLTERLRSGSS